MKKILTTIVVIVSLIITAKAQNPVERDRVLPRDSMPDLWVITMDMSGSMASSSVRGNLHSIPNKISSLVKKYGNTDKDDFVLFKSGAEERILLRTENDQHKYNDYTLVSHLVRQEHGLMNYKSVLSNIQYLVADRALFHYDLSFTALIRPLSIHLLGKTVGKDLSGYNHIYHVLITDDGDINDQWLLDYRYMKNRAPKHFTCYNELLPKIACSEFDFTDKKTGKFVEIETKDKSQPHIYLTEYETYEKNHPSKILPLDSLIEVYDFHKDFVSLRMRDFDTAVAFVYVKLCSINGDSIPVSTYLYPDTILKIPYNHAYGKFLLNDISVEGSYQESYQDNILGLQYRTIPFNEPFQNRIYTQETKNIAKDVLYTIVLLLVAALVFTLIWRNMVVLRVFVNGKRMSIKRKAMNKLRFNEYTIVTVECDADHLTNALFYRDKGIAVKTNNKVTTVGQNKLLIKSWFLGSLCIDNEKTDVLQKDDSPKQLLFENDFQPGQSIQFSYSDRLSHTLIIKFIAKERIDQQSITNDLQKYNLEMLALYYNNSENKINSVRNNVVVNIIQKGSINSDGYSNDYAVLNIFDTHSQLAANHIFLRYSLMCSLNNGITGNQAVEILTKVAFLVLKSERQKIGHVETKPNTLHSSLGSSVTVDVSPMLSYLFLLKKGGSRMVYSPFADGKLGLSSKTIKLYPQTVMILKNVPVGYKKPNYSQEKGFHGAATITFNPQKRKYAPLTFKGGDLVRLLETEKDFSYGHLEPCVGGVSCYAQDISKLYSELSSNR